MTYVIYNFHLLITGYSYPVDVALSLQTLVKLLSHCRHTGESRDHTFFPVKFLSGLGHGSWWCRGWRSSIPGEPWRQAYTRRPHCILLPCEKATNSSCDPSSFRVLLCCCCYVCWKLSWSQVLISPWLQPMSAFLMVHRLCYADWDASQRETLDRKLIVEAETVRLIRRWKTSE